MNITELFNSLKAYINSVIGDKITIASTKATEASNSATAAANSASAASTSASNAASAATTAVTAAVNELKGGAPAAFDTLGEIADELAANQSLHSSLLNQLGEKATKVALAALEATVNAISWSTLPGKPSTFPTNVANISDLPTIVSVGAEPSTLVQRTAQGAVYVDNPVYSGHATHKGYVDTQIGTRAASSHTHSIGNVTGLQSALDGKQPKSQTMTQAQYDSLSTKDPEVTYNIVAG